MIAVMVGGLLLLMLALAVVWSVSPAFRAWAEKPKYTMLERNEAFERDINNASNDQSNAPS